VHWPVSGLPCKSGDPCKVLRFLGGAPRSLFGGLGCQNSLIDLILLEAQIGEGRHGTGVAHGFTQAEEVTAERFMYIFRERFAHAMGSRHALNPCRKESTVEDAPS
jgi:hypothetical protein